MRALVVTWGPGGNLPPLLAAARLLVVRGHEVTMLASAETRAAAERAGLPVVGFRRSPDPNVRVAFEVQTERMMSTAAGAEIALDTRDAIDALRPDLVVVDCMLPAALAVGEAAATPTVSLVHFLYGLARKVMLETGSSWTTDLDTLAQTRRALGLAPLESGLAAWERPDLVLVTAPDWLDVDADAPPHVVHAGPLGVDVAPARQRSRVLLTFSTTVMEGQPALIERLSAAVAKLDLRATLTLGPAIARDAVHVPDAVEVLAFADHDRLLPECALVVSHGGLGTVLRALAHGVPMLILPLGRDQAFNAGRVEALGAGIALPLAASPQRIRAALDRLRGDASFRAHAVSAGRRIAAAHPNQRASEALEALIRLRRRIRYAYPAHRFVENSRPMPDYSSLIKKLPLPPGFVAPTRLTYDDLVARAITRADLHDDVRGINASIALIQRTRGGGWPTEPVTEEFNFVDLVWHELEFRDGTSFAYAVYDVDGGYLGCCYLYPMGRRTELSAELLHHDVDVSWWVTPDAYEAGYYEKLYSALRHWLAEEFPFGAPYYSNAMIPGE